MFTARIVSDWDNCIDCHSTFDGKVILRSVWRSTEEFRNARNIFHRRFGMDWLVSEELDMIPLSENRPLFNVRCLWGGADASG